MKNNIQSHVELSSSPKNQYLLNKNELGLGMMGSPTEPEKPILSDNMKISGLRGDKLVMQVNKYIPHY